MPYGRKRLTFTQAAKIRRMYEDGDITQIALAALFGVSQSLVCKIVNMRVHRPEIRFGGEALVRAGYTYGN